MHIPANFVLPVAIYVLWYYQAHVYCFEQVSR